MCKKGFFPCKALICQVKWFFKNENKFALQWESLNSVRPKEELMHSSYVLCIFFSSCVGWGDKKEYLSRLI